MPNIPTIAEKIANIDYTIGYVDGVLTKYEILFAGNLTLIGIILACILGGAIYIKFRENELTKKIKESERSLNKRLDLKLENVDKEVINIKNGAIYANIKGALFLYDQLPTDGQIKMLSQITTLLNEAPIIKANFTSTIVKCYSHISKLPKIDNPRMRHPLSIIIHELGEIINKDNFENLNDINSFKTAAMEIKELLEK